MFIHYVEHGELECNSCWLRWLNGDDDDDDVNDDDDDDDDCSHDSRLT